MHLLLTNHRPADVWTPRRPPLESLKSMHSSSPMLPSGELTPLSLPPLAAQASISPTNTRRYPPTLAPLRHLPDYCRVAGCANFGKMQGYCHDHIPRLPAPVPTPLLPNLRAVVAAAAAPLRPMGHLPPPTVEMQVRPPARRPAKPPAKCRRPECANAARRKGLCMEHGGRHFCKMAGCSKCAHRGGLCISHGGGRRCAVANCAKSAQSGGICYSHGGGKRCATDGCSHAARSGGFCIKHGKQRRQQRDE